MRCKDCKHFDTQFDNRWVDGKLVQVEDKEWGHCALAETSSGSEHKESLAHAFDSEDYHAWLSVNIEFGCVQFEAKA